MTQLASTRARPASKRAYRMGARADAAAATRERLLAAAWHHFSEQDYERVRLADVAAEAGVSAQTLHAQFGRKDDLFVVAWRWFAAREGARRDASVGEVDTAVRMIYDSYESAGGAALRVLAQEDRIPAIRKMTDSGRAGHRDWVAHTFAPQLGGLSGAARERRLVALIAATDILVWKLLRREMRLPRRTAERIVTEMVDGLKGDR
jgi:AcrR family transcriptional regulator